MAGRWRGLGSARGGAERAVHGACQILEAEGFLEHAGDERLLVLGPGGVADEAGGEEDGEVGPESAQGAGEFDTRETGHVEVGDHEIEACGVFGDPGEGIGGVGEGGHAVTEPFEGAGGGAEDGAFVVHEGDGLSLAVGQLPGFRALGGGFTCGLWEVDVHGGACAGGAGDVDGAAV